MKSDRELYLENLVRSFYRDNILLRGDKIFNREAREHFGLEMTEMDEVKFVLEDFLVKDNELAVA